MRAGLRTRLAAAPASVRCPVWKDASDDDLTCVVDSAPKPFEVDLCCHVQAAPQLSQRFSPTARVNRDTAARTG